MLERIVEKNTTRMADHSTIKFYILAIISYAVNFAPKISETHLHYLHYNLPLFIPHWLIEASNDFKVVSGVVLGCIAMVLGVFKIIESWMRIKEKRALMKEYKSYSKDGVTSIKNEIK